VTKALFVERFLVPADEVEERPAGLRYDAALGLTVGSDGTPFVEMAEPTLTATDTKAFPGDRDRAPSTRAEVTKVLRDRPQPLPTTEETAVLRDRPRTVTSLIELWTRTGTDRDKSENAPASQLKVETRVRRDRPQEPQMTPRSH
jgi:hypothetical protein